MTASAALASVLSMAVAVLAATALERGAPRPHPVSPGRPERIVALSLSAAEMLVAIVPPERIAAVHAYVAESAVSNVREQLAGWPRVGSSAEAILALAPDLVVAAPYVDRSIVEPLGRGGVALHEVATATDFSQIFAELRRLGRLVGEPGAAEAAVAETRAAIQAIRRRIPSDVPAPRVLFLVGEDLVAGSNTTYDELARLAGASNVGAERGVTGLARVPAETLARWTADVVVVPRPPEGGPPLASALRREPQWGALGRARVVAIDEAHLTAASPALVYGLADLVAELHP